MTVKLPTAKAVRTLEQARNHARDASKLIDNLITDGQRSPWYPDVANDITRLADQALTVENKLTVLHAEEDGLRKGIGQP
jgi:hypothetical protein